MIISINDYIDHHLEESSLNTFLLQTGLKGTSRICREKCKGILQNIFQKMYLKYRCKDIIGKHLLKLCAPSKLSISMEHTHRHSLLIRQFTKVSANCLFVIA